MGSAMKSKAAFASQECGRERIVRSRFVLGSVITVKGGAFYPENARVMRDGVGVIARSRR